MGGGQHQTVVYLSLSKQSWIRSLCCEESLAGTWREGPWDKHRALMQSFLMISLFFPTCRKLLAFPNKTHKHTYIKNANRSPNQIVKGQEMPHVYIHGQKDSGPTSLCLQPGGWIKGNCVRNKHTTPTPKYVSTQLKVVPLHALLCSNFLLALVILIVFKVSW